MNNFPKLWRRHELILPTIPGWTLLLVITVTAGIIATRQIYPFLALETSSGASILVIEGVMAPEQLDLGMARFRQGHYRYVITTGGPVPAKLRPHAPTSYAALARDYLVSLGIPSSVITAVPAPHSARDRTYLSALLVRKSIAQTGQTIEAIDIFSAAVHSRRTRALYGMAFGSAVRIGVFSAKPVEYDPDAWWQSSEGTKTVLMEAISWLWTILFFRPLPQGPQDDQWEARQPDFNAPAG